MSCNINCNVCQNLIFSQAVNADATTVVINIPAVTLNNNQKFCLVITQAIPTSATIGATVGITIGTSPTVYPLLTRCGQTVTASMIRSRRRYPIRVATTATGANMIVLSQLPCGPNNQLPSIPAI